MPDGKGTVHMRMPLEARVERGEMSTSESVSSDAVPMSAVL
jgi:hypothetical protein